DRRRAAGAQRRAHGLAAGIVEFQIALEPGVVEEELRAARDLGREYHRTGFLARGENGVEIFALHSTRSTKIATLPPQARPTSQAWSSLMPKSRRRGLPSLIVSCASVMTAPSTQPPETEPINSPLSLTTSLAPGWRGEEPQVLTTVASATPLPSARHRAAWSRISAVSLIIFPSFFVPEAVMRLGLPLGGMPVRRGADDVDQAFEA